MKNCRLLVLLLLAAAACGQTADIHGIKIKQSAFDGTTMTLSLTFINDRAADVTAYHYCSKLISTDPKQTREQCVLIDAHAVPELGSARFKTVRSIEYTMQGRAITARPSQSRRVARGAFSMTLKAFNVTAGWGHRGRGPDDPVDRDVPQGVGVVLILPDFRQP